MHIFSSKRLNKVSLVLSILLFSQTLVASPWQDLELVGETDFRYLFWKVYDARLYADETEFLLNETRPFALEITYNMNFDKAAIVGETRRQWERMGLLDDERISLMIKEVDKVLVNVSKEDTIMLFIDEEGTSHFYHNGELTGEVKNPEFSFHFAAIWLSENSSRPALTERLLGKS